MILGMQWLTTLGSIQWNFQHLQMKFQYAGHRVVLKGSGKKYVWVMEGRKVKGETRSASLMVTPQLCSIQLKPFVIPATQVKEVDLQQQQLIQLLQEYEEVFQEPKGLPPNREFDHCVPMKFGSEPVSIRPYRYPYLQKAELEKLIHEMKAMGIIRDSSSPFSSPVVMVKKRDGSWRLCVDYRELNKNTVKNKFPIPLIEELLDELKEARVFSKLDLRSGYWQIRMNQDDIHKTAFRTHDGHYEFLVMLFGLTNAPATFQGLMNHLFRPHLRRFVLVFFDDILVYSRSWEEHLQHLKEVLIVLKSNHLHAKMAKCVFGSANISYLGHIIDADGVHADPEKINAMVTWPVPKSLKELRGFLGPTGYYRRFIKGYGEICKPLTELLRKGGFVWTEEAERAFEELKKKMSTPPILALPDFTKEFCIEADASGNGMGAVLLQEGRPLAYYSKGLSEKHRLLATYEKELLAIITAIQKWRHYLLGGHFTIKTDHKSLKYLLEQRLSTPIQTEMDDKVGWI
ncbi:putative mitochondrial protein [Apostasia shenzhenica]|uniref:Putative mitochondrial protein n=1 Tax=Apostasia shenzhenica TaxID=1088818 RepID=A0A2I0A2D5_9ASPA|nr:putative mitochondrial protein [Apostasia shenzhenica]